jgi:flagellar FliL protein
MTWLPACLAIAVMTGAAAESAAGEAAARYFLLEPTFVANFGHSPTGRLQYLKADVTLRISSDEAEAALRRHSPYLRNSLVLLFSRQDDDAVVSPEGREQLRRDALDAVRAILVQEEGKPYVEDLVFSNFVVQR